MRVQLWICDRCSLQFVAAEPPGECPCCRRHYSGKTVIRLLGREIEVESVRIYGDSAIKKALKGTDSLRLGERCAHGFIASFICPDCKAI
jgi:hypothetical protein